MADHGTNLRAAGLTVLAVSLFAVSDAVVKLLTTAYPPGQILFCRGVFACLILVGWIALRRRSAIRMPLATTGRLLAALSCSIRGILELFPRPAAAAARRRHRRAVRLPPGADRRWPPWC